MNAIIRVSRSTGLRAGALLLCGLLAACGGEEEGPPPEGTTPTTAEAQAPAEAPEAPEGPAEAPADDGPCPASTGLTIANLGGSPHLDGVDAAFVPTSAFADVTLDRSADFVFTSYAFEADPQFGISAPTGDPEAPDGGLIFQISIQAAGDALAPGEFTEEGAAGGRVTTNSMYHGSSRIVPMVDHSLELTEITEEHVCGVISSADGSFPGVSGRFKVDRE